MSLIAGAWLLMLLVQSPEDPCKAAAAAHADGDLSGAAGYLEECIALHPSDLDWHLRLCAVYQTLGREEDLHRAALRGIERFANEPRFYQTAGIYDAQNGNLDQAIETFTAAATRWPENEAFRANLSQALLLRGMARLDEGDNAGSEADLARAADLDPGNCDVLMNLGRARYNLLKSVEALETFDRLAASCPGYPGADLHRGIVLVTMSRDEEAIRALDRHLSRNDDAEGRYFRGLAWKGIGDCSRALIDLEKASLPGAVNPDAFYEKGGCLEKLGRNQEAESAYRRAAELDASRPRYQLALGQLLVRTGRREEGMVVLKAAREAYAGMVREDQQRLVFKSAPGAAPRADVVP